jgi:16S rRNA (adenine1518-N6/adenine1519-N6)-dimethyltransferase
MIENVSPKKFLGQHFLIDENISKKIVNAVNLKEFDKIVEIGPGKGALSKYLFDFSDKLILIEYDTESVEFIKSSFKKHNPNIIKKDFLKYNLKDVLTQTSKNLIIGNFPYNISSQIIFKILENYLLVGNLIGMFQKEVAERIISKPNSKEYGIISVKTQLLYDVKILFDVSPNVFFPKPRVNSSVISLTRKKNININFDLKLFDKLVKLSFQQRRKKIKNSLKKLDIKENILEDSIFGLRPEQLSVNDFIRLTQKISNETI